ADHVHDRAEVLGLAVVHDQQDAPAEVDVLVLEMRQRQGAHDLWISGLRDVEHGNAAPPAHVRVVVLEVHPGSLPGMCARRWTLLEVASGGSTRTFSPAAGIAPDAASTAATSNGPTKLFDLP